MVAAFLYMFFESGVSAEKPFIIGGGGKWRKVAKSGEKWQRVAEG